MKQLTVEEVRFSWQITNNFWCGSPLPERRVVCDLASGEVDFPVLSPDCLPAPAGAPRARPQCKQEFRARELPAELVHAGSALDFWLLGQDSVRLGDRWDTPCVRTFR